jgi:hypothetical protein
MPTKIDQGRSLVGQPEPDTPHFAEVFASPIDKFVDRYVGQRRCLIAG